MSKKQKLLTPEIFRQAVHRFLCQAEPPVHDEKPRHVCGGSGLCRSRWFSPFSPACSGTRRPAICARYNSHRFRRSVHHGAVCKLCRIGGRGPRQGTGGQPEKNTEGHPGPPAAMRTEPKKIVPSSAAEKGRHRAWYPPVRSSPATGRSSKASPRWTNPPSPANPRRSSGNPAATSAPSPAAPPSSLTG